MSKAWETLAQVLDGLWVFVAENLCAVLVMWG